MDVGKVVLLVFLHLALGKWMGYDCAVIQVTLMVALHIPYHVYIFLYSLEVFHVSLISLCATRVIQSHGPVVRQWKEKESQRNSPSYLEYIPWNWNSNKVTMKLMLKVRELKP